MPEQSHQEEQDRKQREQSKCQPEPGQIFSLARNLLKSRDSLNMEPVDKISEDNIIYGIDDLHCQHDAGDQLQVNSLKDQKQCHKGSDDAALAALADLSDDISAALPLGRAPSGLLRLFHFLSVSSRHNGLPADSDILTAFLFFRYFGSPGFIL